MAVSISQHKEFWRHSLRQLNIASGLLDEENRLLALFYNEITGVWAEYADARCPDRISKLIRQRLEHIVNDWRSKLVNLNFDTAEINHWDRDPMYKYLGHQENRGIAWQAYMLESCRFQKTRNHLEFAFLGTEDQDRQIFFAGVEPTFTIPKSKNQIVPGKQSQVRPDGIGVTRSGKLVVFEVKGPEDDLGPLSAVIQGVLGAIAFQAKRCQLVNVLEKTVSLRPAATVKHMSKGVSVVVMVSTSAKANKQAPRVTKLHREIVDHLFEAVDFIERIAIIRVTKRVRSGFTHDRLAKPPTFEINHYWPSHP